MFVVPWTVYRYERYTDMNGKPVYTVYTDKNCIPQEPLMWQEKLDLGFKTSINANLSTLQRNIENSPSAALPTKLDFIKNLFYNCYFSRNKE